MTHASPTAAASPLPRPRGEGASQVVERRRSTLIAWSLIAAPALLLVGNALHPVNHKANEAVWVAGIADHRTQWYVAHVVILVALPLFVPAVIALLRLLRGRTAVLAEAGAVVTLFGLFATEAFVAVEGLVTWQMTDGGANRDEMVALLERFNQEAGTFVPIGLGTAVFVAGMAVLGLALVRAGLVPPLLAWAVLVSRLIAAAAIAVGESSGEYQQAIVSGGDLVLLLGLGGLGLWLLRDRAVGGSDVADGLRPR